MLVMNVMRALLRYLGIIRFNIRKFIESERFIERYVRCVNEMDSHRLLIAGRSKIVELLRLYNRTRDDQIRVELLMRLRRRARTEPWGTILSECGFRADPGFIPLRIFCIRLIRRLTPRHRRHGAVALDASGNELGRSMNGMHAGRSRCAEYILLHGLKTRGSLNRLKHVIVFRAKYANFRQSAATTAESHPCIDCAALLRRLGPAVNVTWSSGNGFCTCRATDVAMKHIRRRKKRLNPDQHQIIKKRRLNT